MKDVEIIELNVQPSTEVYGYFRSLSYSEGHALAEFIDNSTSSFYMHENELLKKANQEELLITINYDPTTDTLVIEDDAYGMEIDNFKRAVLLGKNTNENGKRNEFGFGLKTAATWFGDIWSVESTEFGSTNLYKITMDINSLVTDKAPIRPIEKRYIERNEHYTIITISKLNKKLNTTSVKKEITNLLGSMYRRDLKSGKIKIMFNGTTLFFDDYPLLKFRNKEWKKELNFNFVHNDTNYNVTGFVAIMRPGGYDKTGFALFKNDRVIIGGYGENFKPKEIFVQNQSQISLKLFGELNMDDFPVTQAKDDLAWTSELRECFIYNLKSNIPEFLDIASMAFKDMDKEERNRTESVSQNDTEKNTEVNENGSDSFVTFNGNNDKHDTNLEENSNLISSIHFEDKEYKVEWEESDKLYSFDLNTKIIKLGKNNTFIKKNINNDSTIAKIILAFAYAENESLKMIDADNKIPVNTYKSQFIKFLKGIE